MRANTQVQSGDYNALLSIQANQEATKKMAEFVSNEFDRYERAHQDRFDKAKTVYEHWLGLPPKRDYSWQNAVHVPITFEAEQTISPRIFAALFPNEAPIDLELNGGADEDEGVRILNLVKHHFRVSDVQGKAVPAIQQCTLLGTGYLGCNWLYRTGWQMNQGVRYQALLDNRPDTEFVSFFELFPHPAKMSMTDSLPVIRRRTCDAEYLKGLAAMPQFKFMNLDAALKSEPTKSYQTKIEDASGNKMQLKKREEYEILEYWGPWDASYEKDNEVVTHMALPYWIMVVNRSVVIRAIPNPFNHQRPPFVKFTLYPDINPSWFGIGIGQVGMACQERVNKTVNQRLDNVDLVMNKQGFYNGNDHMINVKKLQVSMPGAWHKVSDTVGSIRWMDIPDVTASAYQEEDRAKQDYREATGATIPLMPSDEGQHRTATGISLLQGAAGARFRPVLRRMETDMVADLSQMYLSNLQQFMAFPEWVTVTSDNGQKAPIEILPEEIQSKAKFIPTGVSEMLNKEVQIGQLLHFKEVTMQDPTINRQEINKRIGNLMGFKDLDKLIVQQQPVQQGPGMPDAETQEYVQRRLAEGATPDQIKMEILGNPPAPEPEGQMMGAMQ